MGSAGHYPKIWLDAEGVVLNNGKSLTPLDADYTITGNEPKPPATNPY